MIFLETLSHIYSQACTPEMTRWCDPHENAGVGVKLQQQPPWEEADLSFDLD